MELPLFSHASMNLAIQPGTDRSKNTFFKWIKSFFYQPVTLFDENEHKTVRCMINISDTVTKLSSLGLDAARIKKAIYDDRLGELIVDVKADSLYDALPTGTVTKDNLIQALKWVNENALTHTSYPVRLGENNPIEILNKDGGICFKVGKYELGLDDRILRVQRAPLQALGFDKEQIEKIQNYFLAHLDEFKDHFSKDIQGVEIHPSDPKTHLHSPFFPYKVVMLSPYEGAMQTASELGHGAYKTVKKAIDIFSGDHLAYYEFKAQEVSEEEKKLYLQEMKDLVYFRKTKGILQLHKVTPLESSSEEQKRFEVYMKLYDKGSLSSNMSHLSYEEKIFITKQIASALKILHDKNLIHRDLKPANIFLKTSKKAMLKAVIGDLGSLTAISDRGKRQKNLTTPLYASPEYAKAMLSKNKELLEEANDKALDAWSLGVILFELFHGKAPDWNKIIKEDMFRSISQLSFPIHYPRDLAINKVINRLLCLKKDRSNLSEICAMLEDL
jgi:Protein kinase domain